MIELSNVPHYINYVTEIEDANTLNISFFNLVSFGKEWKSFVAKYGEKEIVVPASKGRRATVKVNTITTHLKPIERPSYNFFQSAKNFDSLEDSVKLQIEYNKKIQGKNYKFIDDVEMMKILERDDGDLAKRVTAALKVIVPGAYKADILRYYLLYTQGGVWLDDKSTLTTPMNDPLFGLDIYDGFVIVDSFHGMIEIGFMGSRKNNPVFKEILVQCLKNVESRIYGNGPLSVTGPGVARDVLLNLGASLESDVFNYEGTTTLILHSNMNILTNKYNKWVWNQEHDIDRRSRKQHDKKLYGVLWNHGQIYTDDNSKYSFKFPIIDGLTVTAGLLAALSLL